MVTCKKTDEPIGNKSIMFTGKAATKTLLTDIDILKYSFNKKRWRVTTKLAVLRIKKYKIMEIFKFEIERCPLFMNNHDNYDGIILIFFWIAIKICS